MNILPSLFIWVLIFVVSLLVLMKASDYFTGSAQKIGVFFGVPSFIVGATIVAMGTSLPELVSSVLAVLMGSSEIVVGNVVGSNITNICLILGVSAIFGKKLETTYNLIRVDLPLLVASAFLLALTIWDGTFTLPEALLCLSGFVVFLLYTIDTAKQSALAEKLEGTKESIVNRTKKKELDKRTLIVLVVSAFFIYLGARYTIESLVKLSEILNIGTEIIAASVVALGTSLPELTVSITALRKGQPGMVIGNILGSNIFNALAVMGISALFGRLVIPESILSFALPMMIIATLLYVFITQDKQITKWEGSVLVVFYLFFIGKLFNLL